MEYPTLDPRIIKMFEKNPNNFRASVPEEQIDEPCDTENLTKLSMKEDNEGADDH